MSEGPRGHGDAGRAADAGARAPAVAPPRAGRTDDAGARDGSGARDDAGPLPVTAAGARPGPRAEVVLVLLQLAGDLLSIPFHLAMFLCTRGRVRRAFRHALDESAR